jgi:hypothetical protein
MQLDREGEHNEADALAQRKRPDAWAVHWDKQWLLILEFTLPNDRDMRIRNTNLMDIIELAFA